MRVMRAYSAGSSRSRPASATMRSSSTPTSFTLPASTASGHSVFARSTSTGLPSDGASSWMPPESVIISRQRRIKSSPCRRLTKAARWKACASASRAMPRASHHFREAAGGVQVGLAGRREQRGCEPPLFAALGLQDLDHRGGSDDPGGFVMFEGEEFLVAGHEEFGLAGFSHREQVTVLG